MARKKRLRKNKYDHGGPHLNIPKRPGMPMPTNTDQGVIKATDTSLKGLRNLVVCLQH